MKLTFVTPRYGVDIVGGAEYAVRVLAENCVKYARVEAEVLTTTAGDERTWRKKYLEGNEDINGVSVRRFYNEAIIRNDFDSWSAQLLSNPSKVSDSQFDDWLVRQGPYSPGLLDAIESSDADALIFHPMLSSPASHGLYMSKAPVVLHPALHDEPLAYMPGYNKVMRSADLLAFSTRSEQNLANKIYDVASKRQCVIGFGIDQPQYDESNVENILNKYGLSNKQYAVVIGRVDPGKGSDLIYRLFNELKSSIDSVDTIVFIGPKSESSIVTESDSVVLTGMVPDEEKWLLLANSRSLISPSVTESFSLVVLEAMSLGIPVLVNGNCGPTLEHVEFSKAGASFVDSSTFIAGLEMVSAETDIRRNFCELSKEYILNKYSWEKIIRNYIAVLDEAISSFTRA